MSNPEIKITFGGRDELHKYNINIDSIDHKNRYSDNTTPNIMMNMIN